MSKQALNVLFQSYKLGDLTLRNRIVMASMTRCRADPKNGVPTDLHAKYYAQRASAGLVLTECSPISVNGQSFLGTGGIYTKDQIQGWKKVTDAVHSKGTPIFTQLWHAGRSAIPALVGEPNIGPSAIGIRGSLFPGMDYAVPKEMTKDDIKKVIELFRQAALNAKEADFDGVELHGANGYLIDSFLRTSANQRTDEYGGSVENRSRLCLQVIDAFIDVYGANRVGVKLSPVGRYQDMCDENPTETFTYLVKELNKKNIAYIQLSEPDAPNPNDKSGYVAPHVQMPQVSKVLRPHFKGPLMINNNLTPESAAQAINDGTADLVSFARYYINNPDFVERIQSGAEINTQWDFNTFYQGGEKGYTDYPFYIQPKN